MNDGTRNRESTTEAWEQILQEARRLAGQVAEGETVLADAASQQRWMAQWGGLADSYMRSPPFLESLRSSLQMLCDARAVEGRHTPPPPALLLETLMGTHWGAAYRQLEAALQVVGPPGETPAYQGLHSHDSAYGTLFARLGASPDSADSRQVVTSHEVVLERGTMRLLRYRPEHCLASEPVLICYALVNRPYILDFQPDRSVVQRLLEQGLEVYLIDWGVPAEADRSLTLGDYVCDRLGYVVNWIVDRTAGRQLHLLGYCMGGTLSVLYTALFPGRIKSLVLLATPVDFEGDESLLNLWSRKEYFDVDRLVDTWGNCPGEFLQVGFQLLKPVQNFVAKYITFCSKLDDQGFVDNFLAMEQWASDSIPIAGETFREFVTSLYQENRLVRGMMYLAGRPVHLASITCPILMLVADHDHLVPPASTLALGDHVGSTDVEVKSVAAGHIGLAVSSRAHRELWPSATKWLLERSESKEDSP